MNWNKIKPKMQLGGLFAKGLGNSNTDYNYGNTGHRGTSYDTLQYIPDTPTPDVTPALLNAFMSKYQLKSKFDPSKHKMDTDDLRKQLEAHTNDKAVWEAKEKEIHTKFSNWVRANNFSDEINNSGLYATQLKQELMAGTQQAIDRYKADVKTREDLQKGGMDDDIYAQNGDIMYRRLNPKTNQWEYKPSSQLKDLKGWSTFTNKDAWNLYDIAMTGSKNNPALMSAHLTKWADVQKRIRDAYQDPSNKKFETATADLMKQTQDLISGAFDDNYIIKNGVSTTQNADNFQQLNQAFQAIAQGTSEDDLLAGRKEFHRKTAQSNSEVEIPVRNANGEVIAEDGTVFRNPTTQKVKTKKGTFNELDPVQRESLFKLWFLNYVGKERAARMNTESKANIVQNVINVQKDVFRNGWVSDGKGGFKKATDETTDFDMWVNSANEPTSLVNSPFNLDPNSSLKGNPLLKGDWIPLNRDTKKNLYGNSLLRDPISTLIDVDNIRLGNGKEMFVKKMADGKEVKNKNGEIARLNSREAAAVASILPKTEYQKRIFYDKNGNRVNTVKLPAASKLEELDKAYRNKRINSQDYYQQEIALKAELAKQGYKAPMTAIFKIATADGLGASFGSANQANRVEALAYIESQLNNPKSAVNASPELRKKYEEALGDDQKFKNLQKTITIADGSSEIIGNRNAALYSGSKSNAGVSETKKESNIEYDANGGVIGRLQDGGLIGDTDENEIDIDSYLASIPQLTINDLY